jgi:LysR family glycine cleavage system transcriptional activator
MAASGVLLGDVDMFAEEIAQDRLRMPFDTVMEDGYGYYLKLHADDLSDPVIAVFRSWLIQRFGSGRQS